MTLPMLKLSLIRFAYLDTGTFGHLWLPSGVVLHTVERPWLFNKPRVSCIPEGTYKLAPRHFFRGGYDTYEVTGVPGRRYILFHIANWPTDVEGCIGLGTEIANDFSMVKNSKVAFDMFKKELEDRKAELEVTSISATFND